jgi:putative radical SAM enzyme (TIGR03279 family)
MKPGEFIVKINGHPIRDIIDYRFYAADDVLEVTVARNGESRRVSIATGDEDLGLELEPMQYRSCGNRCIFCFVDQNPPGLRHSLYFKDEDYRLSFLNGNYVTLTHINRDDLERIAEQRLSPLYISVHATDPMIRRRLLGLRKDDYLIEKVKYLVEQGIELHAQVVLCPGINDGSVLKETLDTLSSFHPKLRSIAVVPVGLTRHRQGLSQLTGYTAESARIVIGIVEKYQEGFQKKFQEPLVYLADEFYLLSGFDLPTETHYGDFWQVENGVGMTRTFLTDFTDASEEFPRRLSGSHRFMLVTGTLAGPVLEKFVIPVLRGIKNLDINMRIVENRFYGEHVTVSGLLTGRDIIENVEKEKENGAGLLLPPNCLNNDGLFLDDLTPRDLERRLNRPVLILDDFRKLWEDG